MQTLTDSRRTMLHRAAAVGAAGVLLTAGMEGVDSDEAAAAERKANKKRSCRRFKNKKKRRRCQRRRRRQRKKDRDKNKKDDKSGGDNGNAGGGGSTPPPVSDPVPTSKVLSASERHLVSRFSYGVSTDLADEVFRAGGARAWFDRQLTPESVPDGAADGYQGWWSGLSRGASELWQRQVQGIEGGWKVMSDYQRWLLIRRVASKRQVAEVMTEFWLNHLHVPASGDEYFTYRVPYDAVIRSHALGRFEDMLKAAITHPAMGIYLDNAVSTRKAPNENLGRELLELHTVGRGAYDEDDVKASARILTGYRVDMWKSFDAFYSASDHWTGPVSVMDFSHPNADADGRPVVAAYLSYLARHPRTAQRLARKLAVKFVSDNPPQALVDRLAQVYLANGTAIKPMLRALVDSAEFKGSAGQKVRDPAEDIVATYRVMGATFARPPDQDSADNWAANVIMWQANSMGNAPCGWARPDGQPIDNDSWATPARLVASMQQHWNISGRWWPEEGITYRTPKQWLPGPSVTFRDLVSHLSRVILNREATPALQRACSAAVSISGGTVITKDHALVKWNFHRLLVTFLDSPTHLMR